MADPATSIDVAAVLAVDAAIQTSTGAEGYGLTPAGFVAKPFARLLAEKLALAQSLFDTGVDLTSGSAIRKLLEISALEDARQWAALAATYNNCFVSSAAADALSRLGKELGLPRPFLEATGTVRLKLKADPAPGFPQLTIPRGARMSSPGGHQVATAETVVLSATNKERDVAVAAFIPGPEHNLNPALADSSGAFPQKLDRFDRADATLAQLVDAETAAGAQLVEIQHTKPLTGGELQWPDARYRELLLRAPRSVWSVGAIETAVSLVPGVRQVNVRDPLGGLDINQSIFGNFNFIERLFGTERDLASPYYFSVLVAPTPAAIWDGPDGLQVAVGNAIEDLRPIGIFPQIVKAEQVGIGIRADLVTEGLPLPSGNAATVNSSSAAVALKQRLLARVGRYVETLRFGEPVRAAEIVWAIMNEPGVADVQNLRLVRYPAALGSIMFDQPVADAAQELPRNENVTIQSQQIAAFVDDASGLTIV
jgi:hypothetical protein